MPMTRYIVGIVSVGLMVLGAGVVSGQDYPNRPIRIITAQAGTGSDFDARLVAQGISAPLGQPVIVDNRGSGFISGEIAAKASSDENRRPRAIRVRTSYRKTTATW